MIRQAVHRVASGLDPVRPGRLQDIPRPINSAIVGYGVTQHGAVFDLHSVEAFTSRVEIRREDGR